MQPYSLIVIPFFLAKQLEYMEKGGHKGTPQPFPNFQIAEFSNTAFQRPLSEAETSNFLIFVVLKS
jgi:hypothetical protein